MNDKEAILARQHAEEAAAAKTEKPPVIVAPGTQVSAQPEKPPEKTEKQKADDAQAELSRRKSEIELATVNRGYAKLQDWEASLKARDEAIAEREKILGQVEADQRQRVDECNLRRTEATEFHAKTKLWSDRCDKTMADAVALEQKSNDLQAEVTKQKNALDAQQKSYLEGIQPILDIIRAVSRSLVKQAGVYQERGMQRFSDYLCAQSEAIDKLITPTVGAIPESPEEKPPPVLPS